MKNPIWKGNNSIEAVKNNSLTAMRHHANKQIESLKEHAELLVKQAEEIQKRVELAELIVNAEYNFKPVHHKSYYLYKKEDRLILTLIAPTEWNSPYHKFIAEVRQLGDSTWEEIKKQEKKE